MNPFFSVLLISFYAARSARRPVTQMLQLSDLGGFVVPPTPDKFAGLEEMTYLTSRKRRTRLRLRLTRQPPLLGERRLPNSFSMGDSRKNCTHCVYFLLSILF